MIASVQNPKMSTSDVTKFRETVIKCITKDFTASERKKIDRMKKDMDEIERSILEKNDGKNPILGY